MISVNLPSETLKEKSSAQSVVKFFLLIDSSDGFLSEIAIWTSKTPEGCENGEVPEISILGLLDTTEGGIMKYFCIFKVNG